MTLYRTKNKRGHPREWVSSNAVVPSTQEGIADFLERISRMLSRSGFRSHELSEIRSAVEQVLLFVMCHGKPLELDASHELHTFFTMGPTEFSIRIENEWARFDSAMTILSGNSASSETAGDAAIRAVGRLMDEVRFNAKGNAVTLVRRRGVNHTGAGNNKQAVPHPPATS